MTLRDSGVDFGACDLPDANTLTVGIMVTFAQHEAERAQSEPRQICHKRKLKDLNLVNLKI